MLHRVDKLWWDRVVIPKEEDTEGQTLSRLQFRYLVWQSGRLHNKTKRTNGTSLVHSDRGLQFLGCTDVRPYTCGAGHRLLIIKANGDLMPCRRLPYIIGNIHDGELSELLDRSPLMKELREAAIPEGCSKCKHAEQCRGGAKCITCAKTGSWAGKDPDCWKK